ncbi:MAG: cytochrome c biogenesis protein CcsA [Chloroflexi bacterium]|nr:cytochrome c biogenesis protein CcsA [Chloroflexota bacterium]
MVELEITAHWAAAVAYAVATLVAGVAVCFRRERLLLVAAAFLGLGAAAHAGALGLRWAASGHGPFLGRYEAFSSHALAVVLVFLLLQALLPALRMGSLAVAPVAFLLLGVALLSPAAPTYPSPALRSPWLTIHVNVAKLALATTVAAGAVGALSLVRGRVAVGPGLLAVDRTAAAELEVLCHRLVSYTFFLMSVVILSGALWASVAWGSYWSWDPVETWSLAYWAGCAFVLHLRGAGGWKGQRWATGVVALAVLGMTTFVGYGHFGVSLHAGYIAP